jgi:aryl-alcohol dehydrogenase-like predicted oxidoreductase
MLPIPGTGSVAHLEQNIAAASLALTPDDKTALAGRSRGARSTR